MQSSQHQNIKSEIVDITQKEEEQIVNKLINKYENEIQKLKSYKLTYTSLDNSSRTIVFILLITWVLLTIYLNIQSNTVGTIIIIIGIVYSIIILFRPLIIPKYNNNFNFLLIGTPLYLFIDRRYLGDFNYIGSILFATGIYASMSMIEYPISYEKGGLIRNLTTFYTVLLFLYILYDVSSNISPISNISNQINDIQLPPMV